jgi:hypothetical protein
MDYYFANTTRYQPTTGDMDLAAAERSNGKVLTRTKAGAFAFFLLAGALLIFSLLAPPPSQHGTSDGAPGTTAAIR